MRSNLFPTGRQVDSENVIKGDHGIVEDPVREKFTGVTKIRLYYFRIF